MSETQFQVITPISAQRQGPSDESELASQLLHGEVVTFEREAAGWVYARAIRDGYQGWVKRSDLAEPVLIPTHRVRALRTYVFPEPNLKTATLGVLSMNAKIAAGVRQDRFTQVPRLGWVFTPHLAALGEWEADWVAVAEQFQGAPYQWGGRESIGLDCSGLIQTALEAAGLRAPRDSGDQEAWMRERGETLAINEDLSGLQRGDVVFWPGHVGVMVDETRFLHANAHHMACVIEPISLAAKRIAFKHAPIRSIIRL
ncbi:C40 family peptidase [Woodsholea maritima]|uniref:C40 family peptidase n=1 Tax=Woodsholea maritima TaxID=240237 RepID=UPI00035DAFEA|nr:C40 family peptidase [Woodsholea maritima]